MQPKVHHGLRGGEPHEPLGDASLRLGRRDTVEHPRVHEASRTRVRLIERRAHIRIVGRDDADDRQLVRLREREVALVVTRHRHDRAGAVLHQHVVGDPDRDALARRRIRRVRSREGARLLGALAHLARHDVLPGRAHAIGLDLFALVRRGQRGDLRMLGREHEIRRAEDRVRTRREDHHRRGIALGDREGDLRAFRAAEPVALGALRGLRPVDPLEVVQQTLGVVRDAEEPLLEQSLLDARAAPLAQPILHLLVGEHGLVVRAPVDRRLPLVGEPLLEQLQEDPLRPLVVRRVGGRQLMLPVDHETHAPQLAAEVLDVLRNEPHRVPAHLQGVVLRVDPEGVEANRLEHAVPLQPLKSSMDVGAREREDVPDVQPLGRRVRKHHQLIERGSRRLQIGLVGAALLPAALPFELECGRIVAGSLIGDRMRSGHDVVELDAGSPRERRGCDEI